MRCRRELCEHLVACSCLGYVVTCCLLVVACDYLGVSGCWRWLAPQLLVVISLRHLGLGGRLCSFGASWVEELCDTIVPIRMELQFSNYSSSGSFFCK